MSRPPIQLKPVFATEQDEVYDRVEKAWYALTVQKLVCEPYLDEENAGLLFYSVTVLQSIETGEAEIDIGTYESITAIGRGRLSFDGAELKVNEITNQKARQLWCNVYEQLMEYSRLNRL